MARRPRQQWRPTRREAGVKGPRVTTPMRARATTPVMPREARAREQARFDAAPVRVGRGSGNIVMPPPPIAVNYRFSPSVFGSSYVLDDQQQFRPAGEGSWAYEPGFTVLGDLAQDAEITVNRTPADLGNKIGGGPPEFLHEPGLTGSTAVSPLCRGNPAAVAPFFLAGQIVTDTRDVGYPNSLEFDRDAQDPALMRIYAETLDTGGRLPVGSTDQASNPDKYLRDRRLRWNKDGADMYAAVGSAYNQKNCRCDQTNQNNTYVAMAQDNSPDGAPRIAIEGAITGGTQAQYTGAAGLSEDHFGLTNKNLWHTWRNMQDRGSLNTADGEYRFIVDGLEWRWAGVQMRGSGSPGWDHEYSLIDADNWWPGAGLVAHYEYDYVDDAWESVYLSTQAIFDPTVAYDEQIQIPTVWVAGQVKFRVRYGHLSSSVPLYLFLQLGDGSRVKAATWTPA